MREHDDRVARANRLAALFGDEAGARALAEAQKAAHVAPDPRDWTAEPSGNRVGIWRVVAGPGGPGLRRANAPAAIRRLWADAPEVGGKGDRARVVLIGESVARGYLLDPVITPAAALQAALDRCAPGAHQCVDLARTGIEIRELSAVVRDLPALEPDEVVLVAGNNWSMHSLTHNECDALADALDRDGAEGMRAAYAEVVVARRVERFLSQLQGVAERSGARVTVVVPEFNLTEWEDLPLLPPPLAPAPVLERWRSARERLAEAGVAGRWAEVVALADELAGLDGFAAAAERARGRALSALGDHAAARAALERARDAATGLLVRHTPRATRQVQDALRAFAAAHGHRLVDLTADLADPRTGLPDPAHFLDYCHLAPSGIAILAARLAGALTGRPVGPERPGTPEEVAAGHVLAASHNAWLGQRGPVLRRHLALAAEAGPAARAHVQDLHRLVHDDVPAWTSEAFDRMCSAHRHADRYFAAAALGSFRQMRQTDLAGVLRDLVGPPPAGGHVPEHDLVADRQDGAQALTHGREPAFFRCLEPRFGARLHCAHGGVLRLVYRTPHGTGAGEVLLDGRAVAVLPASRSWREADVPVGPAAGPDPVLEIRWPTPDADLPAARTAAVDSLRRAEPPLLHLAFGDLSEATLRCAHEEPRTTARDASPAVGAR
ncbi:hypothetical protein [Saccharothrix xinjiangensis]|uniref:SGNH hydrolase-type esterase domain-containing protein n=1 Tax=Saccharothrix xinjiangensis TaxID=204798 RepID=A0ABV9YCU2_9PSEU